MSDPTPAPAAPAAPADPAPAAPAAPPVADPQAPPTAPAPATDPAPGSPLGRKDDAPPPPDPNAPAEWLGQLPDDLKDDKTLQRFKSIEDLARGHIEAHKVAKSKVVLPSDDDPASFDRFAAAIRPEDASAYKIDLPEGEGTEFAEAMRPVFHQAGLHPRQVEMLVEANNQYATEFVKQENQRGQDELDALQAEMGAEAFQRGKQAAVNLLDRLGIPAKFDEDLARIVGAGNSVRVLMELAERTGELGRVDATDVSLALGGMSGEDAMEEARRMQRDPDIAPRLADPTSPERKRYDKLKEAAARKK